MPEHEQEDHKEADATEPETTPDIQHPLADAINALIQQVQDVQFAVREFLPAAKKQKGENIKSGVDSLEKITNDLKNRDKATKASREKQLFEGIFLLERELDSDVEAVLGTGLFLSVFAAFDAFTGDLLRALYQRRPELFGFLDPTLKFSEVLKYPSLDVLKRQVLEDEIENIRRKSYVEQFSVFSSRFEVRLTEFANWLVFMECAQRRNLFTHCDGVVSEQYLKICQDAGLKGLPALGTKLALSVDYLVGACETVIEVGVKLGQTLWRKALPDELAEADKHLMAVLYKALEGRIWNRAVIIGEFAFNMRRLSSDADRKIITINYVQGLKRSGSVDPCA